MSANLPTYRLPESFRDGSGFRRAARHARAAVDRHSVTICLNFVPYSEFLLYPLRLFVTFVHESGHALASLLWAATCLRVSVAPE